MEVLANLAFGFEAALTPVNLFYCFLGVFLGTFIGVLPGIGALAAVSMLLPVTFYLPPATAIIMLGGVFYGSEYGGSTASILLNLPGTTSSAVTCLDGYPMAKSGRAGVALFLTAIASFFGSIAGIVALVVSAPALSSMARSLGSPEYFAVVLVGLAAAATITQGSAVKGLCMVIVGLLLGTVGADAASGIRRFTFGSPELAGGISLVPIAMGIFGIAEIISSFALVKGAKVHDKITLRSLLPTRADARQSVMPIVRGSGLGVVLGTLPGTGATLASFMSYAVEKQVARDPSRFGKGAVEGVAGPESANNAAAQAAFIPTLTLGIPGSATMALMLGALMIHGITPGPSLIKDHPDVFWGLIASFWIGNVLLLLLNIPLIGLWVRLLRIPYEYLCPAIICLICIGVYSINNSVTDIYLVMFFGVLGYGMRLVDLQPAALLMGFILGPLVEQSLRRSLLISNGDYSTFVRGPFSLILVLITALLVGRAIFSAFRGGPGPSAAREREIED